MAFAVDAWLVVLLLLGGIAAYTLAARYGPWRRRRATARYAKLRSAGKLLRLRPDRPRAGRVSVLRGELEGRPVSLALAPGPDGDAPDGFVEVRVPSRLPPGWTLRPEGVTTRVRATLGAPDVSVGVADFDARVRIDGGERVHELVSRLPADARAALLRVLVRGTVTTTRGELVALRPASDDQDVATLTGLTRDLVALAAATDDDRPTAARLADYLVNDPDPGYRMRCFELATAVPDSPAAQEIARAALHHRDVGIRVRAARVVGDDSGAEALGDVLRRADLSPTTLAAALDALAELERPPATGLLTEHLAVGSPAVRAAVARCLGQVGGPDAVAALRRLLADPAYTVQAAALEALGGCAPLALVPELAARSQGVLRDARVKRAARQAVAEIQARARGSAGQLSLARAPVGGALALVANDADAAREAVAAAERELEAELDGLAEAAEARELAQLAEPSER